ncbi:MAG: 50S ribosomal protein L17 [Balneolaceae bacterium]
MRHLAKGRKLGRTTAHRKATLQALAVALIKHKSIQTTLPKAKELRGFIEPLITKAKTDTTHNRRQVFSALRDKEAVTILFNEVAEKVGDRPGGYTRVLKLGVRLGDAAQVALIELVDYNDVKPESKREKKKTRRAGRSKTAAATEAAPKKSEQAKEGNEEEAAKAVEAVEESVSEDTAEDTKAQAEEVDTETVDTKKAEAETSAEESKTKKEEAASAEAEEPEADASNDDDASDDEEKK